MQNRFSCFYQQIMVPNLVAKFPITNIRDLPNFSRITISTTTPKRDLDIYLLFFFLLTGKKPKPNFRTVKRLEGKKRQEVRGLQVDLTQKDEIFKLFHKTIYYILPQKENLSLLRVRKHKKGLINFSVTDLMTYTETQQIYNNESNLIVDNFCLRFNVKMTTKNRNLNECFFRMLQLPIRFKKIQKIKKVKTFQYRSTKR